MTSGESSARHEDEREPVVITDKRRIDREGAAASGATPEAPSSAGDQPDENAQLLAERTADLQRLQAEYANYRKRADRERHAAGEAVTGRVLLDFLPVLDNLDRAAAHGDLTGGLKAIADQLSEIFTKLGLISFGAVGDPFDPAIHEAVLHNTSPDVSEPTCTTVMRPGYMHNDRLLRAAMVGVSDPEPAASADAEAEAEPGDE